MVNRIMPNLNNANLMPNMELKNCWIKFKKMKLFFFCSSTWKYRIDRLPLLLLFSNFSKHILSVFHRKEPYVLCKYWLGKLPWTK